MLPQSHALQPWTAPSPKFRFLNRIPLGIFSRLNTLHPGQQGREDGRCGVGAGSYTAGEDSSDAAMGHALQPWTALSPVRTTCHVSQGC